MIPFNGFLTVTLLISCCVSAEDLTLNYDEIIAVNLMVNDLAERGISIADYKSIIENNEKTIKIALVKDNQSIELQGGGDMELKYIISKKNKKIISFEKKFGK
ncbi:hypothetical protein [Rahnella laticis]|uniref:hypothetical protein n=1 Tax=Rahnella laticis TaxID=2787622 RepID=UPI0018A2721E|nr:hypothetical protein [Rahnella laticis]MBF7996486.1 hypothetical protein [Rahnella laticis]